MSEPQHYCNNRASVIHCADLTVAPRGKAGNSTLGQTFWAALDSLSAPLPQTPGLLPLPAVPCRFPDAITRHMPLSRALSLLTPPYDTHTWNYYQRWLGSPRVCTAAVSHTVYFVFLLLIPDQVKNKHSENGVEREQPTHGLEPRPFLSDILSNVLSL